MRGNWLASPLSLATNLFSHAGRLDIRLAAAIAATSLIQATLVFVGSYFDHTWHLPGTGKGLLQHYAAWAVLCTDPLLIVATGYAYYRFNATLAQLPVRSDQDSRALEELITPFLEFISGRGNAAFAYLLCLLVGILSWLNNIRQTIDAVPFYHHEVFDSLSHPLGFAAYKLCLFISWVVIYPVVGFLLLSMSVSTYVILQKARAKKILWPHVTHPDNCYGLRNVGSLNIALLSPYLLTYAVMFTVLITLGYYGSILIPLAGVTIIFLAMSYIVLIPAYTLLAEVKKATFVDLVRRSGIARSGGPPSISAFAVERLCFTSANASPYSDKTKMVLAAMRAIPLVTLAVKFLEQLRVSS